MTGPKLRLYATAPQSKDIDAPEYARRVADVGRWSEEAGCHGILVYTDNGIVDPWLVAQRVIEATEALRPLDRGAAGLHASVRGGEDDHVARLPARQGGGPQHAGGWVQERPAGARGRDRTRRPVRHERSSTPRSSPGCSRARRCSLGRPLAPGQEPQADAPPTARASPEPADLRLVAGRTGGGREDRGACDPLSETGRGGGTRVRDDTAARHRRPRRRDRS